MEHIEEVLHTCCAIKAQVVLEAGKESALGLNSPALRGECRSLACLPYSKQGRK